MNKQNYNRFFHLHTVSGILISVGLYIIFFAGAFTLVWDEIIAWEKKKPSENITAIKHLSQTNVDHILHIVDSMYTLKGRSVYLYSYDSDEDLYVELTVSKDSLLSNAKMAYELSVNPIDYSINPYVDSNYSMGFLFYRLHYFYQLGMPGYYLAGFVSFFFLFAIVTGVVIHWKKIISNFYVFRPWAKLKTVWTDAHTVLGIIGLPYQFMYALTGAMFCLWVVVNPLEEVVKTERQKPTNIINTRIESGNKLIEKEISVMPILDSLQLAWKGYAPMSIEIEDYGCQNSTLSVYGELQNTNNLLEAYGTVKYHLASEKIISATNPNVINYKDNVRSLAAKLHYGDYGNLGKWNNYILKLVYFIMALITCFVIITGVLIWLEARKKPKITEKQRRFNQKVGYWYLAICLSMFPVTAFSLIVSKLIPESLSEHRKLVLNIVFFGGWFVLSLFLKSTKNNALINRYTLFLGGLLGAFIPLISGLYSGNWMWKMFVNGYYSVFIIDLIWFSIALINGYSFFRLKQSLEKANKVK